MPPIRSLLTRITGVQKCFLFDIGCQNLGSDVKYWIRCQIWELVSNFDIECQILESIPKFGFDGEIWDSIPKFEIRFQNSGSDLKFWNRMSKFGIRCQNYTDAYRFSPKTPMSNRKTLTPWSDMNEYDYTSSETAHVVSGEREKITTQTMSSIASNRSHPSLGPSISRLKVRNDHYRLIYATLTHPLWVQLHPFFGPAPPPSHNLLLKSSLYPHCDKQQCPCFIKY